MSIRNEIFCKVKEDEDFCRMNTLAMEGHFAIYSFI